LSASRINTFVLCFILMGSVFCLIRWTVPFDYSDPEILDKFIVVQAMMEIICVAMLFMEVIPNIWHRFSKTPTMEKAVWIFYFIGIAILVYFIPSFKDADYSVQKGIGNVLMVAIVLSGMAISYWLYNARLKKEHPDGFVYTFRKAVEKAMAGTDMEAETGVIMHVTAEGIVILDDDELSSIDTYDMKCKWRVVNGTD